MWISLRNVFLPGHWRSEVRSVRRLHPRVGSCASARAGSKGEDAVDEGRLGISVWVGALSRFATAAAATDSWKLSAAMTHMDNCLRVSEESRGRGGPGHLGLLPCCFCQPFLVLSWPVLGIIYDEIARRNWAEQSRAGVPDFNVDLVCLGFDSDLAF